MTAPDLTLADSDDLAEAIAYALRFNDRGKPLGSRTRDDPGAVARGVVLHLARCGFVVLKKPPMAAHSTG
ncbi:hypothetical protein KTR66_15125 [Roseococcus sp. SDR]|uniref:hypothetical protein n=1 Tax=Roseococcus sp. SDR TaxID=2835532 RepID=UPI001BCD4FD4|nr:hypothetical protein [Roseococcus sp. SDR]MBS7791334.1 hypothetical protein [Roseococcus sp. SDR]MBV1846648.1 hypothetical protein [Roseococcus sp. SDR]